MFFAKNNWRQRTKREGERERGSLLRPEYSGLRSPEEGEKGRLGEWVIFESIVFFDSSEAFNLFVLFSLADKVI